MTFTLALHPEAAKAFETRVSKILAGIERSAPVPLTGSLIGSAAHLPVAGHISPHDLADPHGTVRSAEDAAGELVELTFAGTRGVYQLRGEAATEVSRLARVVSARNEIRAVCDATFVKNSLVRWLEISLQGSAESNTPKSWVEALGTDLAAAVTETTFRVPLVGIVIDQAFRLGPYVITYFSQQDIEDRVSQVPEEHRAIARHQFQQHYQGKVCVEGRVTAVPSKAESFALQAAEDVIRGLRFVHPAAVDIAQTPRLDVYDCKRPRIPHVVLKTASGSRSASGLQPTDRGVDLVLRRGELQLLTDVGLGAVDQYLNTPTHTQLNEAGWGALGIFARGVDSPLWRDRVINALVAAETLLLSNSTEPIQRSLGQRIAVLLGGTLAEKRQVIDDIDDAYKARSAFIHHGEDVAESREPLSRAIAACREVVHYCLGATDVATRQELIRRLDDQLLGGGTG